MGGGGSLDETIALLERVRGLRAEAEYEHLPFETMTLHDVGLRGNLDDVRRLADAGWELVLEGEMSDRLLDTPDGRLFDADVVLRVRRISGERGEACTILTWKGPTRYENGFKVREELETTAGDAIAMQALFARLGY